MKRRRHWSYTGERRRLAVLKRDNWEILDTATGNVIESYDTVEDAWSAMGRFGHPDFVVLRVAPDGRRHLVSNEPLWAK